MPPSSAWWLALPICLLAAVVLGVPLFCRGTWETLENAMLCWAEGMLQICSAIKQYSSNLEGENDLSNVIGKTSWGQLWAQHETGAFRGGRGGGLAPCLCKAASPREGNLFLASLSCPDVFIAYPFFSIVKVILWARLLRLKRRQDLFFSVCS